jgi:serine/threonine-protein kinase
MMSGLDPGLPDAHNAPYARRVQGEGPSIHCWLWPAMSKVVTQWQQRTRSTQPSHEKTTMHPGDVGAVGAPVEVSPLSRFEYLDEIGSGGSGSVHRVRDRNLLRVVAMKMLGENRAHKKADIERFLREAQIHAQLDHPNIVPVHELVVGDGQPLFFIMKLVDGRTMRSWVDTVGRPRGSLEDLHEMLIAFLKVCDAVAVAHSRDIIHCDIKPENVMVGTFGQVYLVDWGIARVIGAAPADPPATRPAKEKGEKSTRRPGLIGTIAYMSPEQAARRADLLGRHTDVFGLGALLYFILAGRPPFHGDDPRRELQKAIRCDFAFPKPRGGVHLPEALCRVVKKAMSRDPAARYESVQELKKAVESFLRGGFAFPTVAYTRGTRIVVEGEPGDCAFIITSGSCLVYRGDGAQRRVLRTLGPDAVFGEMAVLTGGTRTATVEALEDVTVKIVTREALETNLGLDSCFGSFVRAIAQRFAEREKGPSSD